MQEHEEQQDVLAKLNAEAKHAKSMLDSFKKHIHLEELDRTTVEELIDKIVVGKPFLKDGKKQREITIKYNLARSKPIKNPANT